MIHHSDDWLTIHGGDAGEILPTLPAASVHCVVTSPPYWGLRDYGTATWVGGGPDCDHTGAPLISDKSTLAGFTSENIKLRTNGTPFRGVCGRCGASRVDSQLGLEATPEEYVANLVGVFREVRRVLRADGTVWLNLGDSYAGARSEGGGTMAGFNDRYFGRETDGGKQTETDNGKPARAAVAGLKPKDLVGIPWRVAFALQADGWWLRSDIIWSKPNPMPESVTDRPTKAHEYLFLLSKSARYYYDADAVREADAGYASGNGFNGRQGGARQTTVDGGNGSPDRFAPGAGRNLRSVWTIATRPYPGAHFAVFPPELPERCIKAGCPEGGVVLDPFAGSGTVGLVANRLSRRAILIDLNPEYLKQQLKRNAQVPAGL